MKLFWLFLFLAPVIGFLRSSCFYPRKGGHLHAGARQSFLKHSKEVEGSGETSDRETVSQETQSQDTGSHERVPRNRVSRDLLSQKQPIKGSSTELDKGFGNGSRKKRLPKGSGPSNLQPSSHKNPATFKTANLEKANLEKELDSSRPSPLHPEKIDVRPSSSAGWRQAIIMAQILARPQADA